MHDITKAEIDAQLKLGQTTIWALVVVGVASMAAIVAVQFAPK